MTTHRHTLIRTLGAPTASPYASRGAAILLESYGGFEPRSLSIVEVDLTAAEFADLARDPSVLAVPPQIPTALLSPVIAPAGFAAAGGAAAWGITEVGSAASAYDGSGVRVAVLDTGIDAAHPAFVGVDLKQQDFSGSGNGDGDGHGTHCAGTIFGRDVAGKRIGVARGVSSAMIGKVLGNDGRGNSTMLFQGMQWAIDGGAQVISMSLGFDFPGWVQHLVTVGKYPINMATSMALRDYTANLRAFDSLMQFAQSQIPFTGGAVIVAASGNDSQHPKWPISASVPAAANGVVSVGAVGVKANGLEIAPFSNTDCQVVAPGINIESARAGGSTIALHGTSMACPHAAGVAALWWQALRAQGLPANATNVTARLLASADKSRISGYTPVLAGNGVVKAP